MQLVAKWRLLPATGEAPAPSTSPRLPQRAEDRIGPVKVAQLCADYEAGIPTTHLMRTFDLGKGSVLRLLDANGVIRRRQPMTKRETEKASYLYRQGWSLTRIGKELGRHRTVFSAALKRLR